MEQEKIAALRLYLEVETVWPQKRGAVPPSIDNS
jgi:hypothetical protein